MISGTAAANLVTLPNGEKLDAKGIASKVQGMFLEMMLKTMEDSVGAEEGLFGNSSSSEIYRGMLREQLANAISVQLQSPLNGEIERALDQTAPATDLPINGVITSPVGWRRDPIGGEMRFHNGTDIAAQPGADIKAVADGVVIESGSRGSFGNVVVIRADDGRKMLYGHNQVNAVAVGDKVQRGEVIAQVGATGRTTGPHVHFEVSE